MIKAIRNKLPDFAVKVLLGTRNNIKQIPEIVERANQTENILFACLNKQRNHTDFIADDELSNADLTGIFLIIQTKLWQIDLFEDPKFLLWKSKLEKLKAFQL